MTTQPRILGGFIPSAAGLIGQSVRIKTLGPLTTEWFDASASVASVAGKTGAVTLVHSDITDWNASLSGYATLLDPNLVGLPTAPTAPPGTNNTQLATTAFVQAATTGSVSGVASWNTRTGAVTLTLGDVTTVLPAGTANPAMNGAVSPGAANSWSRSDHIHPSDTTKLNLSGGTMTGPIALAADPATSLQAATKQYVDGLITPAGAIIPLMNAVGSAGINASWSRSDHVHPSDTTKLNLSGGTMTGNLTFSSGVLTLAADPASSMQAATKNYVDNVTLDAGTY